MGRIRTTSRNLKSKRRSRKGPSLLEGRDSPLEGGGYQHGRHRHHHLVLATLFLLIVTRRWHSKEHAGTYADRRGSDGAVCWHNGANRNHEKDPSALGGAVPFGTCVCCSGYRFVSNAPIPWEDPFRGPRGFLFRLLDGSRSAPHQAHGHDDGHDDDEDDEDD